MTVCVGWMPTWGRFMHKHCATIRHPRRRCATASGSGCSDVTTAAKSAHAWSTPNGNASTLCSLSRRRPRKKRLPQWASCNEPSKWRRGRIRSFPWKGLLRLFHSLPRPPTSPIATRTEAEPASPASAPTASARMSGARCCTRRSRLKGRTATSPTVYSTSMATALGISSSTPTAAVLACTPM